jgi:beta-phosphoglucomutase
MLDATTPALSAPTTGAEATLAPFPIAGIVFDLDGTLTDNMGLHAEAFARFAARHGLPPLTAADRARLDGKRNSEIFPVLFGRPLPPAEWRAYEEEKESLYRELSTGRLRPLRGLHALLALAEATRLGLAVATSAPAPNVEHTLRELGLASRFPHVVRGDEVPRGKPDPDVFLEAARRMGLAPSDCLAFEDAPSGIAAARRAGMRVVGVTTSFPAATLLASPEPPDIAVPDFEVFLAGPGRWLADLAAARS